MSAPISCSLFVPEQYAGLINSMLESNGYGPSNLSVRLMDSSGDPWRGGHLWCDQSFLDDLESREPSESTSALVVDSVIGGKPMGNWLKALSDNGLSALPEPE